GCCRSTVRGNATRRSRWRATTRLKRRPQWEARGKLEDAGSQPVVPLVAGAQGASITILRGRDATCRRPFVESCRNQRAYLLAERSRQRLAALPRRGPR